MSSSNENLINEVPYVPWWMMGENGMLPEQVQGDQEQPEGIEPSYMIEDVLLPAVAGGTSLARAGLRKGAAALDEYLVKKGMEKAQEKFGAGVLNRPNPTMIDLLHGEKPWKMDPVSYGRKFPLIGGEIGTPRGIERGAEELTGAYLQEKFKTQDPMELLRQMLYSKDVPLPKNVSYDPNLVHQRAVGAVFSNPISKEVEALKVVPKEVLKNMGYTNIDNGMASLMGHEAQHVIDLYGGHRPAQINSSLLDPIFEPTAELRGAGSRQAQNEIKRQDISHMLSGGKKAPGLSWDDPLRLDLTIKKGLERGLLKQVVSPTGERIILDSYYMEPISKEKLLQIQNMIFNDSRIGDPMHFLEMRSVGHFKDFPSFEGNYALKNSAIDAINRGQEVNKKIIEKFDLMKNLESYTSPYRNR